MVVSGYAQECLRQIHDRSLKDLIDLSDSCDMR